MRHLGLRNTKLILVGLNFIGIFCAYTQSVYHLPIEQYLRALNKVKEINGTILLARNNEIMYHNSFGVNKKQLLDVNDGNTHYMISEIAESFIAVAVLKLAQEGKINIKRAVVTYLPQLAHNDFFKGNIITVHQLLNQISGLDDYTSWPEFKLKNKAILSKDSILQLISKKNLLGDPGAIHSYCKTNYFILSCLIEEVSGLSLKNYLTEKIFKTIGLNETGFYPDLKSDNSLVDEQKIKIKGLENLKLGNNFLRPADLIYSTAVDLFKWNLSFYDTLILNGLSNRMMHTMYSSIYGYGIYVDEFIKNKRYFHGGKLEDHRTYFAQLPGEKISVIVLFNDRQRANEVGEALECILLNQPVVLPYKHEEIKLKQSELKKFIGQYGSPAFSIELVNGKLFRISKYLTNVELKPESDKKLFFADGSDKQLEFVFDENKNPIKLWMIKNSVKTEIVLRTNDSKIQKIK